MKKQVLTVVMCLALTTTVAFAEDTKAGSDAIIQAPLSPSITNDVSPKSEQKQIFSNSAIKPKDAEKTVIKRAFMDKQVKERELLYNALNLTDEQKKRAKEIDAKTLAGASKHLQKIQIEARKFRDLKVKHASSFAIFKQKLALNMAKSDANKYFKSSKKSFEAILTKEQKAKFELIDTAKREKIEQFRKTHKSQVPNEMESPKSFERKELKLMVPPTTPAEDKK